MKNNVKKIAALALAIAITAMPCTAFADTLYSVPVSMNKANDPSKASVASSAVSPDAEALVKDNGETSYTVYLRKINMQNMDGQVTNMFNLSGDKRTEVVITDSGKTDYPKKAVLETKQNKPADVKIAVWVDAMDKLMGGKPGSGEADAVMHFDWAAAKEKAAETTTAVSSSKPQGTDPIQVFMNGVKMSFDSNPIIDNGRTYVPVRAIFEKLGAEVSWDATERAVNSKMGEHTMKLVIGSKQATVDGKTVELDAPARIEKGRTLVPLRFISENLGKKVSYARVGNISVIDIQG